jgi:hypothetical protein
MLTTRLKVRRKSPVVASFRLMRELGDEPPRQVSFRFPSSIIISRASRIPRRIPQFSAPCVSPSMAPTLACDQGNTSPPNSISEHVPFVSPSSSSCFQLPSASESCLIFTATNRGARKGPWYLLGAQRKVPHCELVTATANGCGVLSIREFVS